MCLTISHQISSVLHHPHVCYPSLATKHYSCMFQSDREVYDLTPSYHVPFGGGGVSRGAWFQEEAGSSSAEKSWCPEYSTAGPGSMDRQINRCRFRQTQIFSLHSFGSPTLFPLSKKLSRACLTQQSNM